MFTYPELTGSDKQIAWAEDIRRKCSESCFDMVNATIAKYGEEFPGVACLVEMINEAFSKATDSRWWIDNRDFADGRKLLVEFIGAAEYTRRVSGFAHLAK